MQLLKRAWMRFLISLIITALGLEAYHGITGRDLSRTPMGFILLFVIYLILTVVYGLYLRKQEKNANEFESELLDAPEEKLPEHD